MVDTEFQVKKTPCRHCKFYDAFTYYGSEEKKFRYCTITNDDMEMTDSLCDKYHARWKVVLSMKGGNLT